MVEEYNPVANHCFWLPFRGDGQDKHDFLLVLKTFHWNYYLPFEFRTAAIHTAEKVTLLRLTSWAPLSEPSDKTVIKLEWNSSSRCWHYRVPGSVLNAPHTLSRSVLVSYSCCHNSSTAKLIQQKKQTCIIWKEWRDLSRVVHYLQNHILYNMYSAKQFPEGSIGVKFFPHKEDNNWVIQREAMWCQLQSITD